MNRNWYPIDQYSDAALRRMARETGKLSRAEAAKREIARRESARREGER